MTTEPLLTIGARARVVGPVVGVVGAAVLGAGTAAWVAVGVVLVGTGVPRLAVAAEDPALTRVGGT